MGGALINVDAALRPPHLKAIIPWEAVSDLYREMAFHGGIPETGFVPIWWKKRMMAGRNKQFDFAEDFLAEIDRHPLEDSYWRGKQTALERINAPALVCASWTDQGLHTRGSLEAFERIGSAEKWLYTHGRRRALRFHLLMPLIRGEIRTSAGSS